MPTGLSDDTKQRALELEIWQIKRAQGAYTMVLEVLLSSQDLLKTLDRAFGDRVGGCDGAKRHCSAVAVWLLVKLGRVAGGLLSATDDLLGATHAPSIVVAMTNDGPFLPECTGTPESPPPVLCFSIRVALPLPRETRLRQVSLEEEWRNRNCEPPG